jgi:hypothetical protein
MALDKYSSGFQDLIGPTYSLQYLARFVLSKLREFKYQCKSELVMSILYSIINNPDNIPPGLTIKIHDIISILLSSNCLNLELSLSSLLSNTQKLQKRVVCKRSIVQGKKRELSRKIMHFKSLCIIVNRNRQNISTDRVSLPFLLLKSASQISTRETSNGLFFTSTSPIRVEECESVLSRQKDIEHAYRSLDLDNPYSLIR